MTYSELEAAMECGGMTEGSVEALMDIVQEESGRRPEWKDEVPPWLLYNCEKEL